MNLDFIYFTLYGELYLYKKGVLPLKKSHLASVHEVKQWKIFAHVLDGEDGFEDVENDSMNNIDNMCGNSEDILEDGDDTGEDGIEGIDLKHEHVTDMDSNIGLSIEQ